MATTAHEVALGVSVESRAAEASLTRLGAQLTSIGDTFRQGVLASLADFNRLATAAAPQVGTLASAVRGLNAPLRTLRDLASSANSSLSAIQTGNTAATVNRLNLSITSLAGGVGRLAAASTTIAGPLSTLSTALGAASSAISTLNVGAAVTQLRQFADGINAIDARTLSRQIGVITVALDRGAGSMAAYPPMMASMARSFQRLGAVDIGNIFREQIVGITGLNSALATALAPVQNYATALRTIASASRGLAASSSSIGALSAQAAGIQLLSNAITLNIVNLQRYAAAMSTVSAATSTIARSSASTGRLVTSIGAMAAAAPTVAGAFVAMNAAVGPFVASLRSAASSAQRLYTRLVQLATISGSLSTAIGSSRSSMGLFTGILGVAAGSIASQIGLLGRLASSYSSTGTAARSTGSAVSSSNSAFSKGASVVSALVKEVSLVAGAYVGAQALQEFGKKILKTGADFDNAMGMVKAVSRNTSDYSTEAFMAMEREAFRMGRTTTYSATQAAEALKELTQGGLTTQQAIQSLGDTMTLAETENMSMADASRTVTSMMAQFQASASDLTSFVDKLAKTSAVSKTSIDQLRVAMAYVGTAARSANQPFAEVVSAIGALSTAGVESSQAGTTLRDMLTDLTDTTSYASRKLRGLGLDMDQVNPRSNKLSEIIGTLRARGIDAADAMGIFGVRGGLAAGSLITVYKQYMDVLNAVQNKSEGTAAIMQQDVTNNLRKDFDKLAASWDYVINRIFKSGLGDALRGYVQQLRSLVIEAADFVDMLSNANKFGDLGKIAEVGLTYAFGVATNYLGGALKTLFEVVAEVFVSRMKVLGQVQFWSGVIDILKSVSDVLQAGFRVAAAELMDANQKFATDIVATMMYAGDVFAYKLEKAKTILQVADSRYFAAKVRLDLATYNAKLVEDSFGKDLRQAQQELLLTPKGSKDEPRAQRRFKYTSDKYTEESSKAMKETDEAIAGLEVQRKRIGIGDYTGKKEDFMPAAKDAVGDISSQYKTDAAANMERAKASFPQAAMAVMGMLTKDLASPIIDGIRSFKPMDLVDTTPAEARLRQLMKDNAATPPSAPTKTKEPFTTGKVSQGVGEIKLDSKSGNTLNLVVGSMKEVGSGIWTSKFGAAVTPLERATTLNTAATNNLTAAITRGAAGTDIKDNTSGITGKNKSAAKMESETQTDIETWFRTGKRPERLQKRQDAVNAENKAKEEQIAAEQQRNADIQSQVAWEQKKERITATIGTEVKLGNPVTWALKKGISPALDKDGKPIAQPNVRLGLPADIMFGSGRGDFGDSTTLYDLLPQIRRGASSRGNRSDRATTPTDLTSSEIKKLQTFMPKDEGYKQRTLDSDPLSTAPFTMQSGLSYDQEGLKYQLGLLYPEANYTIDERRKQQLLNSSPLENMDFSPLSTLPIDGSLSQMRTPQISDNGDKNGQLQLAELSTMSSILGEINGNIIKGNAKESQKLSIKIT